MSVLIVGGYGTVGTVIASNLPEENVIIAGRSEARARKLAAELGVRWRVLDVTKPLKDDEILAGVDCVVMCLDLADTTFVQEVFRRGIDYVDISAEYPILSAVASLDALARQHGSAAVLSVGLVPGLSNLMARHSLRYVDPIEHFDSAILAGLGEKHGVAGSSWILAHLNDCLGQRRFEFREPYGRKTAHRFAFSDQYTLPQTLPVASAATWLGFDSFLMTQLIALARVPVLRGLFRRQAVRRFLLNSTQRFQFGTDEFVLATQAYGQNGRYQAWLRGRREAVATGLVAVEVVRRMQEQRPSAGVHHIEQVFQLEDFLPLLEQHGMSFADSLTDQRSREAIGSVPERVLKKV
jgi:hypothetical protein